MYAGWSKKTTGPLMRLHDAHVPGCAKAMEGVKCTLILTTGKWIFLSWKDVRNFED